MAATDSRSILAIVVVKDGARWLKDCLASLARQTHPRLGVLAVDNGSTDGSGELLEKLLGQRRVLSLERNLGYPGAVARALATEAAAEADFVLLLHDDAVLAKNAVSTLLAAVESDVGIVGPKILDAERPRLLREVGHTMDRFGYPYQVLEDDEIDLGQHDSSREVLYVSGTTMLVARAAWQRAGPPDERLRPAHGDLDFCWRVRIAGFRVVMEPRAMVRHRSAGDRGLREGVPLERGREYDERSALVAMMKNYRALTLLWLLPLLLGQGIAKALLFVLTRHVASARQVASAWGWALVRLPGTVRRRLRVQATRVVPDRAITRYMAPTTTRLRRWFGEASSRLFPSRGSALALEEDAPAVAVGERVRGAVSARPALLALVIGVVVSLVAFRHVLFASPLEGGSLPLFPESARDLFARFLDGWVPGSFGGPAGASPALVPLAVASVLTLGNPQTLAWIVVAAAPLAAAVVFYRTARATLGERGASIAAASSYALSAVVMWAVSEGRIASIAYVVALPWIAARLLRPFDEPVERPLARIAGTAVVIGIAGSFLPSLWAPLAIVVVLGALTAGRGGSPVRGVVLAAASVAGAALLAFPFVLELARVGTGRGADLGMGLAFSRLLRLSPGPAPGGWVGALFLPIAGVLGLALAGRGDRRVAWRFGLTAALCLPLAWLAAAGRLSGLADDPAAYLGLAAFSLATLVGLGFKAVVPGVERHAFGIRQIAFGALATIVGAGIALQGLQALIGSWAVGEDRIPAAYPVVRTADPATPIRVLWLGGIGGGPFPAPGGSPEGVVEARAASVRYSVTARAGRSILSVGVPASGPAYERLERALRSVLVGRVRHGGSLLAPFGIGFVVAGEDDLPPAAEERLDSQLDLLPAQRAGGLAIYRNARAFPIAGLLPDASPESARAEDVLAPARVVRSGLTPMERLGVGEWHLSAALEAPGLVVLGNEHDPAWRLEAAGTEVAPFETFGWAMGFEVPAGAGPIRLVRHASWVRTAELGALGVLWAAALRLALRRRPA